jgi:hypothetical protein
LILVAVPVSAQEWYDPEVTCRVPVDVDPAGYPRSEPPVEIDLDFAALLADLGRAGPVNPDSLRVIDAVLGQPVPFQLDTAGLVFVAAAVVVSPRRYHVYFDSGGSFTPAQVMDLIVTEDGVQHEQQESFSIRTPACTWYYHKPGAGFASLDDHDGNDWIGYTPGGGSAGEYRGIPNLGQWAHPGYDNSQSVLEIDGPVRARIRSQTNDSAWENHWDIFPRFARMTLDRSGGNYWFLYEGTPGGGLDADDYCVRSPGTRTEINTDWNGDLPQPEWAYFGDEGLGRIIYLVHHEDDVHSDQFWQMQDNMTVFGFGRQYTCCDRYMTEAPATFTVGLADATSMDEALPVIEGNWRTLQVTVGAPESMIEDEDAGIGDADGDADEIVTDEDAGIVDDGGRAGDDAYRNNDCEVGPGGSCSCGGGATGGSLVIGLVLVHLWLRFRWGSRGRRSGT